MSARKIRKAQNALYEGEKRKRIAAAEPSLFLDNLQSLDILDNVKIEHKAEESKPGKCEYISYTLECNVGGFGHVKCHDADFHEKCPYKLRVKAILSGRAARARISEMFQEK